MEKRFTPPTTHFVTLTHRATRKILESTQKKKKKRLREAARDRAKIERERELRRVLSRARLRVHFFRRDDFAARYLSFFRNAERMMMMRAEARERARARDEAPLCWTNLQNFTRKHTHARIKEYLTQNKRFRKDAENTNHPFFVTESVSFCDRILLSVFFARSRAQISRIFSSRGGKNSKIGEIFSSFRIRTREREPSYHHLARTTITTEAFRGGAFCVWIILGSIRLISQERSVKRFKIGQLSLSD